MKTVLVLAGLVALVLGGTVPKTYNIKTKTVDADFVARQKKVLSLFTHTEQECSPDRDDYITGSTYSVESNIENYTNKEAVEEFLSLYRSGFMPKFMTFSVFHERQRDEAIALFKLFYYAKDFETFYKTALFAKILLNEQQFYYALYIAVLQRPDTHGIVLPAPYEAFPGFFINQETLNKIFAVKMSEVEPTSFQNEFGIVKEGKNYVFYANYSDSLTYPNDESRLSYFTEDIGLNSYYYYFHIHLPFWWNSNKYEVFKERRGEIYYYFYQQLLARYYLERLTNGLGHIPEFSWYSKFKTGYNPLLTSYAYPYAQRSNNYDVHNEQNYEYIRFLDTYEKTFFQYLQKGHFKAFDKEVDLHSAKAINFVGNYWQTNADLYSEDVTKDYQHSYEITARRVLGAAPKPFDKYSYIPSSLDFYQTSLRDPAFYQLYQRIIDYFIDFKQILEPYSYQDLHFVGVKINDVKVDKLVTFFDYYDFNATNKVYYSWNEYINRPHDYIVRQPRLNHQPFTITVNYKSDVVSDAVFKFNLCPKNDFNGFPITLEQDWNKCYEIHYTIQKLKRGENTIVIKSDDFTLFKDDSLTQEELFKLLDEGKVPHDMSVLPINLPRRLMLPKGTKGGYPFQLFTFVYPYNGVTKHDDFSANFILDNKPFGYPFDRPINEVNFKQPNMFYKDVAIYHEGEPFSWEYNVPAYFNENVKKNKV